MSEDSNNVKAFKEEANRLFNKQILPIWKQSLNVWRDAWAMDTILDYFAACKIDTAQYGQTAVNVLNPTARGEWWDDFGWIGIAALRAAEQNVFPDHRDDLLKITINAWAYMYGPDWSQTNTAIYPFTDVPGWSEFKADHTPNLGAPNVWADIAKTWPGVSERQQAERRPRFSPGGIWNAPITGASQPLPSKTCLNRPPSENYVSPIQNTVTNGVYTILSLRIYQASQNPAFEKVFEDSTLDTGACLQAWKDQIEWFGHWLDDTLDAEQSMRLTLDEGTLIRERASTFHMYDDVMYWDSAYLQDWLWTGDQGLLLGALREGQAAGDPDTASKIFGLYPDIVKGVFKHGYQHRSYNKIEGDFLLPWIVIGSGDPLSEPPQANDYSDYQTGNAVFMQYLLQAYKAVPALVEEYKDYILNSAEKIIQQGFGTDPRPAGSCDAYTPSGGGINDLTAYINCLSVLVLAIEMSD